MQVSLRDQMYNIFGRYSKLDMITWPAVLKNKSLFHRLNYNRLKNKNYNYKEGK